MKSRAVLLRQLVREAEEMLQGSLSETTRTCGRAGCRCQRGERHGPHTYLTFKTPEGRSSAVYVPAHGLAEARRGVEAWKRLWELAVELAGRNRDAAVARWRARGRGGLRLAQGTAPAARAHRGQVRRADEPPRVAAGPLPGLPKGTVQLLLHTITVNLKRAAKLLRVRAGPAGLPLAEVAV